jgi:hypothetical protein
MITTGELPFIGKDRDEVKKKILSGKYKQPTTCTPECKDLIQKMICV